MRDKAAIYAFSQGKDEKYYNMLKVAAGFDNDADPTFIKEQIAQDWENVAQLAFFARGLAAGAIRLAAEKSLEDAGPTLFPNKFPDDEVSYPRQTYTPDQLKNKTGVMNYVVTKDGQLIIGRQSREVGGGHIDLGSGDSVQAAGEVKVINGKIKYIDNSSGHYEPTGSSAEKAAVNAFNKAGLDATDKYIEKVWNGKKWVPVDDAK